MKTLLLALGLCATPLVARAQIVFDHVSGVFRAAITLSDLPWGGTRIDLMVQNTQGPGEAQAIVQSNFSIGGLLLDHPSYIGEYGGGGSPEGGAVRVGANIASIWVGWPANMASGWVYFEDEPAYRVLVAGCTPIAGERYPDGHLVYGSLFDGYIQTCGSDSYAHFTLDVPRVTGTPGFSANQESLPAVVTPEPASLALLGTGLLGLVVVRHGRSPRGCPRRYSPCSGA